MPKVCGDMLGNALIGRVLETIWSCATVPLYNDFCWIKKTLRRRNSWPTRWDGATRRPWRGPSRDLRRSNVDPWESQVGIRAGLKRALKKFREVFRVVQNKAMESKASRCEVSARRRIWRLFKTSWNKCRCCGALMWRGEGGNGCRLELIQWSSRILCSWGTFSAAKYCVPATHAPDWVTFQET
jgi:hypothetical protein